MRAGAGGDHRHAPGEGPVHAVHWCVSIERALRFDAGHERPHGLVCAQLARRASKLSRSPDSIRSPERWRGATAQPRRAAMFAASGECRSLCSSSHSNRFQTRCTVRNWGFRGLSISTHKSVNHHHARARVDVAWVRRAYIREGGTMTPKIPVPLPSKPSPQPPEPWEPAKIPRSPEPPKPPITKI